LKNILLLEDSQTINFITPYLTGILSKIYKNAYLTNQESILRTEPPIEKDSFEQIYEPIYNLLKNQENELINLKNEDHDLDDIKNIVVNIKAINMLPDYFTKIRNDISKAIRNLSIDSWNDDEDIDLALDLIKLALKFNVNSKTKDKLLSDQNDLEKIKLQREELPLEVLRELQVVGIEHLTIKQFIYELNNGASFRRFKYATSIITVTYTKVSSIIFIKSDENYFIKGLPYALKTLFFGWWAIPYGPIYSIGYLFSYLFGGENMTKEIKKILKEVK